MECIGWLTEFPGRLQYEVWRLGRDKAKLDKQNFRQNHTQNQPEEGSVAFASECNAPLDKDILDSLLQKLNVATTLIATKRNSQLCFLVSLVPDSLPWTDDSDQVWVTFPNSNCKEG